MMWNRLNLDTDTGNSNATTAIITIIVLSAIIALVLVFTKGWPSGTPVLSPCDPGIVKIARLILSLGFAVSAFILGLQDLDEARSTAYIFLLTLFFALQITCAVPGSRGFGGRGHRIHPLVWKLVIPFLLPVLIGFLLGVLVKMIREYRNGPAKPNAQSW